MSGAPAKTVAQSAMHHPREFSVDTIPQSIVVVPGELPNGEIAHVQVRPRGLQHTFVVLSALHLDDLIFMRAGNAVRVYEYRHPEDAGHIEFSLFPDGRLEVNSDSRGREVGTHVPTAEHTDGNPVTTELRARAATVPDSDFPGYGRARVVEYRLPRQR